MVKSCDPDSSLASIAENRAGGADERRFIAELFLKYRASLHRYLSRFVRAEDASELVQETYCRLLSRSASVQFESHGRAFLFHAATNLARDFKRRKRSRHGDEHVSIQDVDELAAPGGPDTALSDEQTLNRLLSAIAALPDETRTIFLLYRYRDLSIDQVASVMGVSRRTVARKLAQALALLSKVVRTRHASQVRLDRGTGVERKG